MTPPPLTEVNVTNDEAPTASTLMDNQDTTKDVIPSTPEEALIVDDGTDEEVDNALAKPAGMDLDKKRGGACCH